jgi:hypothetical protein
MSHIIPSILFSLSNECCDTINGIIVDGGCITLAIDIILLPPLAPLPLSLLAAPMIVNCDNAQREYANRPVNGILFDDDARPFNGNNGTPDDDDAVVGVPLNEDGRAGIGGGPVRMLIFFDLSIHSSHKPQLARSLRSINNHECLNESINERVGGGLEGKKAKVSWERGRTDHRSLADTIRFDHSIRTNNSLHISIRRHTKRIPVK